MGYNLFRDRMIRQFFANMPVQPVPVSTVVLEPTSWTPTIEAIGTVSAINGVDLTVEVSGIVSHIGFEANDHVEKGAVLVQLDDAIERAELAAAEARANLDQTSLRRAVELQRREVGTDVNVDSARAAAQVSAAAVEKARAALDQKQIRAPFSGVIGIPKVVLGQYITPGTIVATLQDLTTMRVDFTVPEQSFYLLEIGQPVRLGADGADGTPHTGIVRGIDPKIDPSSRLANVRAEVANPDGRLTPGQFTQVHVVMPEEGDVLTLPQTAVVTSLYGDHVYVVRPSDEGGEGVGEADADTGEAAALVVRQVFVKTGRRSGDMVEILDGLSAGDRVVTAGQNRLSNGAPVTLAEEGTQGAGGTAQAVMQ